MKNPKLSLPLILALLILKLNVIGQSFNNEPKISFINHNIPKSPESTSFEKYGNIPVGEYTGVADVGIPLYDIRSNRLNLPLNLSYHASGIKVNQEATWVGLGWDMVAGGRVTLEIKGGYDRYTDQYLQLSHYRNVIKFIQTLITPNPNGVNFWGIFPCTYGVPHTQCELPTDAGFDPLDFDWIVKSIEQYGIGEPDMYHVTFLGQSFSFYEDLFTKEIKMKGEFKKYSIEKTNISGGGTGWGVTDDNGTSYFFEQEEKSYFASPVGGMFPDATTSWLLTRIVDSQGETINFSYTNFGTEFPAPAVSESETTYLDGSFDYRTNINSSNEFVYQEPQYLSKIESKNAKIDFLFAYRDDIGGMGARRLEKFNVINKHTNEVVKRIHFNYDYFVGQELDGFYFGLNILNQPTPNNIPVQDRLKKRLKLLSLDILGTNQNIVMQSYKFYYNELPLPNKVSLAQDHWGYFNGANNIQPNNAAASLTPTIQSLVQEGILQSPYLKGVKNGTSGSYLPTTIDITPKLPGHANRRANPNYVQAGMLKSIVYPTGGWTNFEYELHKSFYSLSAPDLLGGGLRIKRMANFSDHNTIESVTTYEYKNNMGKTSGIYLGTLSYLKANNNFTFYLLPDPFGTTPTGVNEWKPTVTLFSSGNLSNGGPVIGYSEVKKRHIDYKTNNNNGYIKKTFKVREGHEPITFGTFPIITDNFHYLANTPERYLDGQLVKEEYYNATDVMIRSVAYYYTQINKLDTLYNLKVADNRIKKYPPGAYDMVPPLIHPSFYFEPVRSYYTQLDSTITTAYEFNGTNITKSYKLYNEFNQPEYSMARDSKGGLVMEYVKTPLSYTTLPALPGTQDLQGNALAVQQLRMKSMYNEVVEGLTIRKDASSDTSVVSGIYRIYDENANIKETYQLETAVAIPFAQFQNSVYNGAASGYDILRDTRYKLKQSALYYTASSYLKQITDNSFITSFITDTQNDNILAVSNNAMQKDIAYSSFENAENGNWLITGGTPNITVSHTGKKSYNIGAGNAINRTGLSAGDYVVSYWLHSGSLMVNGMPANATQTVNGWTYYEYRASVAANADIQLTGTATIDELRLYPASASITTYTHEPLVGITSITDIKAKSTYYDYDDFKRLAAVRDPMRNILKNVEYNYNTDNTPPSNVYFSRELSQLITKNNCPAGQAGSAVPYKIPEGKYTSFMSQENADAQATSDMNMNGQMNANNLGSCTVLIMSSLEYYTPGEFNLELYNTQTEQYSYYALSGSGVLNDIPQGTYFVRINEANYTGTYEFSLGGSIENGTLVTFSDVPFSGTTYLYISEF